MDSNLIVAPPRHTLRLPRSNSSTSVLDLKESSYPQNLYMSSITKKSVVNEVQNSHLASNPRNLHDGHKEILKCNQPSPILHPVLITVEERQSRISQLLKEAKKVKPLGKCPLFKMTLTFRSFVWEPTLFHIYGTYFSQPKMFETTNANPLLPTTVKKCLIRSSSATSFKSNHNHNVLNVQLTKSREESSVGISQKSVKKDLVKLSMLAPQTAITNDLKVKNTQKGNNLHQTDLPTQRSLKLGAIPRYLTSRKAEWAQQEEEKIKNMPDRDCPSGHVVMPELDRLETLQKLKKNHLELLEEYNSLPVSKDTLRVRQKKEDIEKQLIKIEEGIRVLSKPKVFVRIDHPKETSS